MFFILVLLLNLHIYIYVYVYVRVYVYERENQSIYIFLLKTVIQNKIPHISGNHSSLDDTCIYVYETER